LAQKRFGRAGSIKMRPEKMTRTSADSKTATLIIIQYKIKI